jgi:oligopeptide/dipeptide ABC transporter ATP-binding protein
MYLGRIVEVAATEKLYRRPLHPYTRALLSASPVPDPTVVRERIILKGDVPSALHAPAGCPFHTRCEYAVAKCTQDLPPLEEIEPDHFARCWRARELAPARIQLA